MWGIIQPTLLSTIVSTSGLPTTDIIVEHKFLFIRYSQIYVEELLEGIYDEVIGDVIEPDNGTGKRWLKWLGAEIGLNASAWADAFC